MLLIHTLGGLALAQDVEKKKAEPKLRCVSWKINSTIEKAVYDTLSW
jgi:hypothetical protein